MSYESAEMMAAAQLMVCAAELNAEIAGMVAENKYRETRGETIAYDEGAFWSALNNSGCHANARVEAARIDA